MNSLKVVSLILQLFLILLVNIPVESFPTKALESSLIESKNVFGHIDIKPPSEAELQKCENSLDFSECVDFQHYPSKFMYGLWTDGKVKPSWFDEECKVQPNKTLFNWIDDKNNLCSLKHKRSLVAPKGVVINGTFYYVVQIHNEIADVSCSQHIIVEMCSSTGKKGGQPMKEVCKVDRSDLWDKLSNNITNKNNYKFYCVQKWNDFTILTLVDLNGKLTHKKIYKPAYCVCEYQRKPFHKGEFQTLEF